MLSDEFERADQIIIALYDLLDLLGSYRNLRLVLIRLAHAQASNQLKLVADEVRVVDYRGAGLLRHLDELCQDVVTFRTMSR